MQSQNENPFVRGFTFGLAAGWHVTLGSPSVLSYVRFDITLQERHPFIADRKREKAFKTEERPRSAAIVEEPCHLYCSSRFLASALLETDHLFNGSPNFIHYHSGCVDFRTADPRSHCQVSSVIGK